MSNKFWEFWNYVALVGLVIGQVTIGFFFYVGQVTYLITNIIILVRGFAVKLPKSDNIKNICMTALCLGVLIIKLMGV